MSSLKLLGTLVLAYTCVVAAPAQAQAQQGYPNRPIRFVVPYPPGGLPDVIARVLGQRLSDSLGTPIVVENKPGAMGRVAAGALTSAPADGYTFLVTDSSMLTIGPLLSRAAAADVSEIEPVTMVGDAPLYLLVHPDVPAKTLEEFVSYARTRTQRVNYGSSGNGTVHHLAAEALRSALQLPLTHVPYKGSAASVAALRGGQIEMVLTAYPNANSFSRSGQARVLGVTSAARSPVTPDVPSVAETVLPGYDFSVMVALFTRKGTPEEATARIAAEVARVVKRPDMQQQLYQAGMAPSGVGKMELVRILKDESARMVDAAKAANLQSE